MVAMLSFNKDSFCFILQFFVFEGKFSLDHFPGVVVWSLIYGSISEDDNDYFEDFGSDTDGA